MAGSYTTSKDSLMAWLMEGDPSIRYQVMRDLLSEENTLKLEEERARISRIGWGGKLLSKQDKEGTWAQSLYSRKWISTTYTLLLLTQLGLSPDNKQAQIGARILLNKGFFRDGGINYWDSRKQSETCVTGITLRILAYFQVLDDRLHEIARFLFYEQMQDKGWNCQSVNNATHSSFHTTLMVMEGLWEYGILYADKRDAIKSKIQEGLEFLLQHRLFKSHKTGKVVNSKMTLFSFPPYWYYDIMRALDFARKIKAPCDNRFEDAIHILKSKQNKDGTWNLQNRHSGKTFFEMEQTRQPSRWNTLRALRILHWWGNGSP